MLLHISAAPRKPPQADQSSAVSIGCGAIAGRVAEQRAVVHARRADDLAGIEHAVRVERLLDLLESAHQPVAEHRLVELGAHQAVAVLAGMGALVGAHHGERFLGDRAHRLDVLLLLQIEDRPHVQAADRGVRVPGAARAVPGEQLGQPRGVVGQVLERHRAVLDERHRFAGALHRHDDVEPGLAYLPDPALGGGLGRLDHRAPKAEIGHQLAQTAQLSDLRLWLVAGELDQQESIRRAAHEALDQGPVRGDLAAELEDGAIDQLDRRRPELDDRFGRGHGVIEGREVADAEHPMPRQRLQLQQQAAEEGKRAFRADQELRHVVPGRLDAIEIVAADPAQNFGKSGRDRARLPVRDGARGLDQLEIAG